MGTGDAWIRPDCVEKYGVDDEVAKDSVPRYQSASLASLDNIAGMETPVATRVLLTDALLLAAWLQGRMPKPYVEHLTRKSRHYRRQ